MILETLAIIKAESPLWMEWGLCGNGDHDPEDWFPYLERDDNAERTARAVRVCKACPVRSQCLDWAYDTDEEWAVCGGQSALQRKQSRARLQRNLMHDLGVE
jgi:WhiB family redox-sensing transcriptional regulator